MKMNIAGADKPVSLHAYKHEPKTRHHAGEVTLDGKKVPVKVTCRGHAKFPAYTYLTIDGQLYYAQGDHAGATVTLAKDAAQPAAAPTPTPKKK